MTETTDATTDAAGAARAGGAAGWARDLPVGRKLAALIGLGLVLASAVTVTGMRGIGAVAADSQVMASEVAKPGIDLAPTWVAFVRERLDLLTAAAASDQAQIDAALTALKTDRATLTTGITAYAAGPVSPEQKKLIATELMPRLEQFHQVIDDQLIPLVSHPMTDAQRGQFNQIMAQQSTDVVAPAVKTFRALNQLDVLSRDVGQAGVVTRSS